MTGRAYEQLASFRGPQVIGGFLIQIYHFGDGPRYDPFMDTSTLNYPRKNGRKNRNDGD